MDVVLRPCSISLMNAVETPSAAAMFAYVVCVALRISSKRSAKIFLVNIEITLVYELKVNNMTFERIGNVFYGRIFAFDLRSYCIRRYLRRVAQAGRIQGSDVGLRDGREQTAQGVHSGAVAAAEPLL